MNNRHIIRAGRPVAATAATVHAPNAALLIDFDNVTLGIRSDLTKELRTLLNSDIIKGKVAVQRAYADWRRYPQYIVPLSESSIDLIFAPAFGTNKKNATDIRLAVDAIELVFTRPEIGTFILLSGDSDFSSMVIKLKEYGKYVIGVGIRESASDLLIQNCDEYYSYSDLAGLTKEEDTPSIQRDPWELVREAAAQMVRNDDVMRSDRLKQVMKQIDPHFDEKNAGYSRFSKFVTDAGAKGILVVNKMENGQYEIAPVAGGVEPPRRGSGAAEQGGRTTAGQRGRGAAAGARHAVPEPTDAPIPDEKKSRGRRRGGRGRGRGEDRPAAEGVAAATGPKGLTLASAFGLMSQVLAELPNPVAHDALRARMAALHGREDPLLEEGRFTKLLRQANDAEVADVRKTGDDSYEVSVHPTDIAVPRQRPAVAPSPAVEAVAAPH
ncbi:MAG: NYN domain-containing protein [Gemmatimonadales bacterium]